MKTTQNQKGSSHIMLVLVVVLAGVIGFAAWNVMNKNNSTDTAEVSAPVASTGVPAKIETKVQAKQAASALDAEQIDKTLDSTALSNDLKSIL